MTLLVFPAAAARARLVAPDDRRTREIRFGLREQRRRLGVARHRGQHAPRDRGDRVPHAERAAVPRELRELRRARDRVGESRRERRDLGWRNRAAKIEQPVEAERLADRIRRLERKTVGERFVGEADAVLLLEQRTKCAADRHVLDVDQANSRILQRFEELARAQRKSAVAHAAPRFRPEPLGADVIAIEKRGVPRRRIDDIAVPLDEQHVRGRDVRKQRLQHELRVGVARGDVGDRDDVDAVGCRDARGQRVGQQHRAREADALARLRERTQRERVVARIDAAQRDAGKLEHRRGASRRRQPRLESGAAPSQRVENAWKARTAKRTATGANWSVARLSVIRSPGHAAISGNANNANTKSAPAAATAVNGARGGVSNARAGQRDRGKHAVPQQIPVAEHEVAFAERRPRRSELRDAPCAPSRRNSSARATASANSNTAEYRCGDLEPAAGREHDDQSGNERRGPAEAGSRDLRAREREQSGERRIVADDASKRSEGAPATAQA